MQICSKHVKMAEKTLENRFFFEKTFDIYKKCCIFAKVFSETPIN